jgi:uncharacterized protein YndB with AHSA1/START domain
MNKAIPKTKLVISRRFDAPRELVWGAWTNPEEYKKWWGPKDFSCPHCEIDLRIGGKYLVCMRSSEGKDYWSTGTYDEIIPQKKLVFTDSFANARGNVVPASYYNIEGEFPLMLKIVLNFEEINTKTKITLKHIGLPKGEVMEQAKMGWNQSFDKLADSLTAV